MRMDKDENGKGLKSIRMRMDKDENE